MFIQEFEKTSAFHYPGRRLVLKGEEYLRKGLGHAVGTVSPTTGGHIYEGGLKTKHLAEQLKAETRAPRLAAELKSKIARRNYLRSAEGKKPKTFKDSTIERHAKNRSIKESVKPDIGKAGKEKSFVSRHPRTALGLGIAGTYALTRQPDQSPQNPQLGQY